MQRLPRLPLLVAFLAGTVCGVASLWPARAARNITPPPATIASAVVASPPALRLQLESEHGTSSFGRNVFAFLEPPRPPRKAVPQASPPIATPLPVPATVPPVAVEPADPVFAYRYIGSFGPRDNVFAAFARDGNVINIRVGEMISEGFRLRRIADDGVDVSWSEDTRTMRVPLMR